MLVPMAKVQVVGLRREQEAVIAAVHRLGVVEISPMTAPGQPEAAGLRPGSSDRQQIAQVEVSIDRLGALLALLPPDAAPPAEVIETAVGRTTTQVVADATALLRELEPLSQRLTSRLAALEAELGSLHKYRDIVQRLAPLTEALMDLEGFETLALVIQAPYRFVLDTLREELQAITHRQSEVVAAESEDGSLAALLIFSRRFALDVHRLLEGEHLTEVRLPSEYQGRQLRGSLSEIIRRQGEIPDGVEMVRHELEQTLRPHQHQLYAWRAVLLDRLDELAAVSQCLHSDYTFALGGWVPVRSLPTVERDLAKEFDGRVVTERLAVSHADWDQMPVLLENAPLVRPFEVLLRLLPSPRYGTVDPTPFVAFFFPLYFGLILGDIGYGALLLALALWVRRRRLGPPWMGQAAQVMVAGSLAAITFGVAFGEFFGDLGRSFGIRPLVADRQAAILPLLLFSVGLGAVQVALGLVLGMVNSYLKRRNREALSRVGTLMALAAVFALVGIAADLLPVELLTPGVALLVAATAILVYTVGLVGPLEVVGALGNVLSYTRLVGVGLASVVLAHVANELAGRTGSVVLGLIVGGLLHALNLGLGMFSPTVQSLRLQYVEFLGRFFEPGGRPYAPFRSRLSITEEKRAAPSRDSAPEPGFLRA